MGFGDRLGALFGPAVVVREAFHGRLLPAEARLVAGTAAARQVDFAVGRSCARAALTALGYPAAPLLSRPDRTPDWPAGAVGSLSHTQGYGVAAVARCRDLLGIGIDAERLGRLGRELWPKILTAREVANLAHYDDQEQDFRATLAFSAKEAYFKCQFPSCGRWLDFRDAEVDVVTGEVLQLTVLPPVEPEWSCLRGRYLAGPELVVTAFGLDR